MESVIKPINRSAIYEDVLDQMIALIKGGSWLPGEKIPSETSLAQQFAVSRNSVREALKALALFGVLESRPGMGTYIQPNALARINNTELIEMISNPTASKERFLELMQVRILLEAQIAAWAAERITPEKAQELMEIVKEQYKLRGKENSLVEKNIELQFEFHEKIAEIAGNTVLIKLLNAIRTEIFTQRYSYLVLSSDRWEHMLNEHRKIAELISSGKVVEAKDGMEKHLIYGMNQVLEAKDCPGDE
ncbi:GntR family transcriptional regulator, transcriptional repressor for pyruvate dehydrogenase complex [Dethiosulfovibrio salsuginis]|uniref:GntR family transcriptional regulator, transcriptional repressor for pyruvate dehydrogenase complex n=2 Tax=Dethiosulfovibrio salsuginis TaxID=561720 RepID=A0A1X7K1V6_9BACT|nr:GntR family transcriptional regulator, transcriptional repressor for pyruvate dehydrogenase complex [Dethiosulfovibrio salsuginis]